MNYMLIILIACVFAVYIPKELFLSKQVVGGNQTNFYVIT
jgi:hypothetical protein